MHILLVFALLAQSPAPPATGRLVEKVACRSDPTQTYTLYLPSAYTTQREWPLLFVFDPRGRGTFAAEIFRDARTLDASGDLPASYRAYTSIVETYDSVADVTPARARLRALDADDAVKRARRDEAKADEREGSRKGEIGASLVRFMTEEVDTVPQLLGALRVNSLLKAAQGTGYEAASNRRTLEQIFVQVSFYIWRDFEAKHDYRRAALSLEVAVAIHPQRPLLWINLAADRARFGSKGSAMRALERAGEAGYRDAGALETDTQFLALQKSQEFIAFVQKLKGSSDQAVR